MKTENLLGSEFWATGWPLLSESYNFLKGVNQKGLHGVGFMQLISATTNHTHAPLVLREKSHINQAVDAVKPRDKYYRERCVATYNMVTLTAQNIKVMKQTVSMKSS